MKKILRLVSVTALLVYGGQSVQAQVSAEAATAVSPAPPTITSKWDSSYRPKDYHLHAEAFRSFPDKSTDIYFLGNSITARGNWQELLGRTDVRNRGISGDITFGVLERLSEVYEGHPKKVFILIGINDISRNIPDSVIVANYYKIVNRIKKYSPDTKIYFETLLPVNKDFKAFKNHYNKDQHILWINQQIRKMGKRENIQIIDIYPAFLDDSGKLMAGLTEDGLHLNIKGYHKWIGILKPYLNQ